MSNGAYPCPLSAHSALLRPVAMWLLDTFGDGPPMLVGVEFTSPKVKFHPVRLHASDPLDTMAGLTAPDSWDVVGVVVEARDALGRSHAGVVAHCVDREGRSATELDEACGRRRALRTVRGRLHDACLELLFGW